MFSFQFVVSNVWQCFQNSMYFFGQIYTEITKISNFFQFFLSPSCENSWQKNHWEKGNLGILGIK
jgi:hypothetical protein